MNAEDEVEGPLGHEVNERDLSASVTFIDVLFAVVMSIGLSQIMTRPWFNPTTAKFNPAFAFEIFVILIGYSTLLLSWWGYHRSVNRRGYQYETWAGKFSSAIDILILVGYWLLLVKFQSLLFVLCVLAAIYFMYACWDYLRFLQGRETDVKRRRRRGVTNLWTLVLLVILGIYTASGLGGPSLTFWDWIFAALALVVNVIYRVHKERLTAKRILDFLTPTWGRKGVLR